MYMSQLGQDKFLNEVIFKGKRNGTFVDIGAHDGISLSNTFYFEKHLGWSGLCIEPNPDVFKRLVKNRICRCLNYCVGSQNETVRFCKVSGYDEMLSGIETANGEEKKNEISMRGGIVETINIECRKLADLIKPGTHIDFCSIDVEGAEIEVLKGIDFSSANIDVLVIEDSIKGNKIRRFVKSKGYRYLTTIRNSDLVFLKNNTYRFSLRDKVSWWYQERIRVLKKHFSK